MNDNTEFDDSGPPTQRMRPEDLDDTGEPTRRVERPTESAAGRTDDFPTRRFDPATPIPAEHTEILDIPPDPRAGRATGLAVAMVILALLVAAGVGYATRVPHPSGLVARGLIGPGGGKLPFDSTGAVEIPRGALSTATTITVRRVPLDQDVTLKRQDGTSVEFKPQSVTLYVFEPSGTVFNTPITIRLPTKGKADTALVVTPNGASVIAGTQQGNVFVIKTETFTFS